MLHPGIGVAPAHHLDLMEVSEQTHGLKPHWEHEPSPRSHLFLSIIIPLIPALIFNFNPKHSSVSFISHKSLVF